MKIQTQSSKAESAGLGPHRASGLELDSDFGFPISSFTARHRALVAALLAVGLLAAAGWYGRSAIFFITLGPYGPNALVGLLVIVAGLVAVPAAQRVALDARAWLDFTVARRRWLFAFVAGAASVAYVCAVARGQGRALRPYVHDEFSYLIQAHQLAKFHGWMPRHPLAPFFDSFQIFSEPVYASAYFPGTAMLFVPGMWLGAPPWVTAVLLAGVVAALLFRIVAELLDAAAAVLAVLLLWNNGEYRALATMTMAQMPVLAAGLAAVAAWLSWRSTGRRRWALAIGFCLAWAAITRPVDALCFAIPIGVAVAIDVARRRRPLSAMGWMAIAAVPLALLQLSLDRGITGHWTETPFRLYADRDYPGTSYGFHALDPAARPASPLWQKQVMFFDVYLPVIRDHTPARVLDNVFRSHGNAGLSAARLEITLVNTPAEGLPMLLPLIPVSLAGLVGRRAAGRAVLLSVVPLFVGLYTGYVFFFLHYTLTAAASVIVAVLLGAGELPSLLPARWAARGATFLALALAGLAVFGLRQFDPADPDDLFPAPFIEQVDAQLATLAHRPAIVLFAYDGHRDVNEEPVYNPSVAWPDDADVIRAHDLGPARDAELFRYYAERQPGRYVYRYDEHAGRLTPLGTLTPLGVVTELARHPPVRF
jgi:hypothetical protein